MAREIITDLDMLQAFSEAMFQTLDALMLQRATVAAAASATDVELVLELGAVRKCSGRNLHRTD